MLALGPDRQMCFPARGSRGQRGDLLAPSVCLVGPRTSRVWAAPGDGNAWPLSVAVTGAFVVETLARRGEVLRKQGCHGPPPSQRCREAGVPSSPTHPAWGSRLQVHEM